jgi:hypothetical protein
MEEQSFVEQSARFTAIFRPNFKKLNLAFHKNSFSLTQQGWIRTFRNKLSTQTA